MTDIEAVKQYVKNNNLDVIRIEIKYPYALLYMDKEIKKVHMDEIVPRMPKF
jgi:hypothetical protein